MLSALAFISGIASILLMIRTYEFVFGVKFLKDVRIVRREWPTVSFVIPACNEQETILSAAATILAIDYPNLEVVIVNDRSQDNTQGIINDLAAHDKRIKSVHLLSLPDGWLGKIHALDAGIHQTKGDWIVLADADAHFSVTAVKKAVSYCVDNQIDFFTLIAEMKSRSTFLAALIGQLLHQGTLFFNPSKLNDPKHKLCYGQGSFIMMNRAAYLRSPGLQWLSLEVLDDTGLAYMMRDSGAKMGALSGKGEVMIEWYTSIGSYIRGLEKNAFAFCQYDWKVLIFLIAVYWTAFFSYTVAPALCGNLPLQIFCWGSLALYLTSVYVQLRYLLGMNIWQVMLIPLAVLVQSMIFFRAAMITLRDNGIFWRGTFYPLDELKSNQRLRLKDLLVESLLEPRDQS